MKHALMTGTFLAFIIGGVAFNALTPDRQLSETENRPLAQRPTLTSDSVLSGEFMSDFETYVTDQFFAKDWWVGLKAEAEVWLQKAENNGVYLAKDDFLLEAFTTVQDQFEKNLVSLNHFHERLPDLPTTAYFIPTAVEIYRDKLPLFAPVVDQVEMLNHTQAILDFETVHPLETLMAHREEAIYYRTDHHWSMLGAFYAYQSLMKTWGISPYLDYSTEVASTTFQGTYYSKANRKSLPADEIILFHANEDFSVTTTYNGKVLEGLYDRSYLNKKDQYSMFLGGNNPLTVIRSGISNGQKLIVFKDSYAHSFVPFLVPHFEEIHLVDLRYFNQNPYQYIEQEGFDRALFLYNLSTFAEETSLIRLKAFSSTGS